jgi:hypothetical protein
VDLPPGLHALGYRDHAAVYKAAANRYTTCWRVMSWQLRSKWVVQLVQSCRAEWRQVD